MSEDLNFSETTEERDEMVEWVEAKEAEMQEKDVAGAVPAIEEEPVPHPLTALDSAIREARRLHIDTSTDQGVAIQRVQNNLLAVVDELRDVLRGVLP